MKMHIIFVSLACVSMVCVTTPVEASPKEARHTSIQTRASTQLKLEPKKYILSLLLWHVFPWYVWQRPSRFPRKRLVTLPCRHVPSGMTSSVPCPVCMHVCMNMSHPGCLNMCFTTQPRPPCQHWIESGEVVVLWDKEMPGEWPCENPPCCD